MTELDRASGFEEALRERVADRVVPFAHGTAVITDSLPLVWDLNLLRVEHQGASAAELAAETERVQAPLGLAHRRVATLDGSVAGGFQELGWEPGRYLFMRYRGSGERRGVAAPVEEVARDDLLALQEAMARSAPWAKDEESVRQVLEAQRRAAAAAGARHLAVVEEGEVVSKADLLVEGRVAQVEDVMTVEWRRGRGYASAVVRAAVAEAERLGCDFIFLIADAEDWPKELYARLGFEPIGEKYTFQRRIA